MQALVEHREDDRLGETDHEQADTAREDDLLQGGRAKDVARAGEDLGQEAVFLALELGLGSPQEQKRRDDRDEAHGVEHRHRTPAGRRVDPRADERRDQPQTFAHRLEHPVRLAEQLARTDHRHQR